MSITKQNKVWITGNGLVFPQGNASTNRLTEVANGFTAAGWDTKLIPLGKPKSRKLPLNGFYKEVEYEYINRKKRFLDFFPINFIFTFILALRDSAIFIEKLKKENVSLVFCGTASPYAIYLLWFSCKKVRIPFVYDIVEDPVASWLAKDIRKFSFKQHFKHLLNFLRIPLYYLFVWRLPEYLTVITSMQNEKLLRFVFNQKKNISPSYFKIYNKRGSLPSN